MTNNHPRLAQVKVFISPLGSIRRPVPVCVRVSGLLCPSASLSTPEQLPAGLAEGNRARSEQQSLEQGHSWAPSWRMWALIMITALCGSGQVSSTLRNSLLRARQYPARRMTAQILWLYHNTPLNTFSFYTSQLWMVVLFSCVPRKGCL